MMPIELKDKEGLYKKEKMYRVIKKTEQGIDPSKSGGKIGYYYVQQCQYSGFKEYTWVFVPRDPDEFYPSDTHPYKDFGNESPQLALEWVAVHEEIDREKKRLDEEQKRLDEQYKQAEPLKRDGFEVTE